MLVYSFLARLIKKITDIMKQSVPKLYVRSFTSVIKHIKIV